MKKISGVFISLLIAPLLLLFALSHSLEYRMGKYLMAQCGNVHTRDYPLHLNSTKRNGGHFMNAIAAKGGSAIVNAIPKTPDKLWIIAFCDSIKSPKKKIHKKPKKSKCNKKTRSGCIKRQFKNGTKLAKISHN